jgi:hypothetical protein
MTDTAELHLDNQTSISEDSPVLEPVLIDLIHKAQVIPDIPQGFTFGDGLRVEVLAHEGRFHLQLSRMDEFPTVVEFQAVLANWPNPIEWPTPAAVAHSGRFFLTGNWLKPTQPLV